MRRSATIPRLSSEADSANSKPSERTQPRLCHSYPVCRPRGAVQLYDRVDGRVYPGSSPGPAMTKDGLKARHFLSDFPNSCYPAPCDHPPPSAAGNEVGMDHDTAPAPRRLDAHGRLLRRGRVFTRLREGWAYDEIAREEGLTAERIRQIVREVLKKRPVDDGSDHAKLQLARLAPAMQLAGDAVLKGEVKAIAPLLKVLDRLDRLQKGASENHEQESGERPKHLDQLKQ